MAQTKMQVGFIESLTASIAELNYLDTNLESGYNYAYTVSSRNLYNVVEDEVVESLAKSVITFYPKLSYRYYSLKAKWFGVKTLKYWDRNAPVPFQSKKFYSWNDARNIVLNSYFKFNPIIGEIAKKFFQSNILTYYSKNMQILSFKFLKQKSNYKL